MKVAYIAGPYRAGHGRTILENCRAAEQIAIKFWRLGYAVICPHKNTEFFDGLAPDSIWLDGDLEILKRCDTIVIMSSWKDSSGATNELNLAQQLGKEIIYVDVNGEILKRENQC
jgi:hypothetical protein